VAGEIQLTVMGNLAADPTLEFSSGSKAYAKFTICQTGRKFNKFNGTWEDVDPVFMRCIAWGQMAEHIAESFAKGTRVIATGLLKQNNFQDKEGQRRSVMELNVDDMGASVKFAVASVARPARTNGPVESSAWETDDEPAPF
jgi:single-strand DNA-binding protein